MIALEINGKRYEVDAPQDVPLLWVIREHLNLTGTKYGCGIGVCGSCTVHLNSRAAKSCQIPVGEAQGKSITTIEGIPESHPLVSAWMEEQVPQCGYCQPGQIMTAAALLAANPNPDDRTIDKHMDAVFCRCGTYPRVKKALKKACSGERKRNEEGRAIPASLKAIGLNPFVRISPDETVTILIPKSEMGQGAYTALAMIVAEELEADWKRIRVEAAPARKGYEDPGMGIQVTGGSTSVRNMCEPLRKAGAAARETLVQAAAETWGVAPDECEAASGAVRHAPSGRVLSYGSLCEKAAPLEAKKAPRLKDATEFRIIGRSMTRLDLWDKIRGRAEFGVDVFLPDMLYGTVSRPPTYGASLLSYDKRAVQKIPGVRHVVEISRGLGVMADTCEAAWKGRDALNAKWSEGSHPQFDNEFLEETLLELLKRPGAAAMSTGDLEAAFQAAAKEVRSVYVLPYLAHAAIEPMNCVAHVRSDGCDVWGPMQNQTSALLTAATITGLSADRINIRTTFLGGGFGRRLESDYVGDAVELSKAVGKPVKLLWTRPEDIKHDYYRPGHSCEIRGALDPHGRVTAWRHKVAASSIWARVGREMVTAGVDPSAVEGIVSMPYEIPALRVEYVQWRDGPIPVGFWRSVGHSYNAFTVECFIDELAHAAGSDPLEFRLKLLEEHARATGVLERVAEKAGWGKPLARGNGRGISMHFSFGSYVAHAVEVSARKEDGSLKVERIVCAVDCGKVINPDTVVAQMEGGAIMGLSAAMREQVVFYRGGVKSSNFSDYPLLTMSQSPEIEVHIIKSNEEPSGIGEPGLPPIAPAVANALFDALGIRVRRLPLLPETILASHRSR
jgi:isoquinoline 1-oxidoreductase beta subunit